MFPGSRLAAIASVLTAVLIAAMYSYSLFTPVASSEALLAESRLLLAQGDHQKAEVPARQASAMALEVEGRGRVSLFVANDEVPNFLFEDANLDGLEDLVVTNGHIDDLTSIGEPYKMPTQFFQNVGNGRFVELVSTGLGPFFQETHLGRGLARLDWNRDGLDDFAVSLIGEPAGLLTNQTQGSGHFLAIQLRGTISSRDAIGTSVEITVSDRKFVKQLTAGDGYQASNERQLRFGLGTIPQTRNFKTYMPGGDALLC